MKLWHSFVKELLIASRGFYFYVEIVMAFVFLFLLLFVIPDNFSNKSTEYLYLDLPKPAADAFMEFSTEEDLDKQGELVEIKSGKNVYSANLIETDSSKIYYMQSAEAVIQLAEAEKNFGGIVKLNETGDGLAYEYYLQGYESDRMKNLLLLFHNTEMSKLEETFNAQEVRPLSEGFEGLTDKQNMVPVFLTFNGSFMGMFIIAAYIFLDKKEGVIKAFAVTASSVWQYLMSKIGVILATTLVSSLIITIPVMGTQPNYLLMILFLLATGFFASTLGLFLASFYKDIVSAFGAIYALIIVIMLPNIAYFIPSWDPTWLKIIPSYPMLEGFKEIILPNGDAAYVLWVSLGFLAAGLILFVLSNKRYQHSLTV